MSNKRSSEQVFMRLGSSIQKLSRRYSSLALQNSKTSGRDDFIRPVVQSRPTKGSSPLVSNKRSSEQVFMRLGSSIPRFYRSNSSPAINGRPIDMPAFNI